MTTPSDFFGIGVALRAMFATYTQTARRSGRTTRLLDCLRDGDRVVVASTAEQRYLMSHVRDRGLDVAVVCVPPQEFSSGKLLPIAGRTHLDHGWIEKFYERELNYAERALSEIQERLQRVEPSSDAPNTWSSV